VVMEEFDVSHSRLFTQLDTMLTRVTTLPIRSHLHSHTSNFLYLDLVCSKLVISISRKKMVFLH